MKNIFNKSIKTSELLKYKEGLTEIAANLKLFQIPEWIKIQNLKHHVFSQ